MYTCYNKDGSIEYEILNTSAAFGGIALFALSEHGRRWEVVNPIKPLLKLIHGALW